MEKDIIEDRLDEQIETELEFEHHIGCDEDYYFEKKREEEEEEYNEKLDELRYSERMREENVK